MSRIQIKCFLSKGKTCARLWKEKMTNTFFWTEIVNLSMTTVLLITKNGSQIWCRGTWHISSAASKHTGKERTTWIACCHPCAASQSKLRCSYFFELCALVTCSVLEVTTKGLRNLKFEELFHSKLEEPRNQNFPLVSHFITWYRPFLCKRFQFEISQLWKRGDVLAAAE